MADGNINRNPYEEQRRKQMEENIRRFQELGVAKAAQNLKEVTNKNEAKVRSKKIVVDTDSLRRSSRPRNAVVSYTDEFADDADRPQRKRSKSSSCTRPRKAHEKEATEAERAEAIKRAENFKSRLGSANGHPSYVKSMLQSHVYHGFWLNVPKEFCDGHLTKDKIIMWLEDVEGKAYATVFIGEKTGFSGGWQRFALDHKLDDGDALVFELVDTERFKVHIFRVSDGEAEGNVERKKSPEAKSVSEKVIKSDDAGERAKPSGRRIRNSTKAEGSNSGVLTRINKAEKATNTAKETNGSTSTRVQPSRSSKQISPEPKKPAGLKNARTEAAEPKKPVKRRRM
ncbi:hypothetical protein MKW94_016644 [Papaver nudicaule]|uniref:TF-B3 domain-containing protein n=1 Tax=Papaver nudicaule TaxID=74823 RepID=A0AA41V2G5_PAPNU|nr:hypothetical protein [Papaver nudicaule]